MVIEKGKRRETKLNSEKRRRGKISQLIADLTDFIPRHKINSQSQIDILLAAYEYLSELKQILEDRSQLEPQQSSTAAVNNNTSSVVSSLPVGSVCGIILPREFTQILPKQTQSVQTQTTRQCVSSSKVTKDASSQVRVTVPKYSTTTQTVTGVSPSAPSTASSVVNNYLFVMPPDANGRGGRKRRLPLPTPSALNPRRIAPRTDASILEQATATIFECERACAQVQTTVIAVEIGTQTENQQDTIEDHESNNRIQQIVDSVANRPAETDRSQRSLGLRVENLLAPEQNHTFTSQNHTTQAMTVNNDYETIDSFCLPLPNNPVSTVPNSSQWCDFTPQPSNASVTSSSTFATDTTPSNRFTVGDFLRTEESSTNLSKLHHFCSTSLTSRPSKSRKKAPKSSHQSQSSSQPMAQHSFAPSADDSLSEINLSENIFEYRPTERSSRWFYPSSQPQNLWTSQQNNNNNNSHGYPGFTYPQNSQQTASSNVSWTTSRDRHKSNNTFQIANMLPEISVMQQQQQQTRSSRRSHRQHHPPQHHHQSESYGSGLYVWPESGYEPRYRAYSEQNTYYAPPPFVPPPSYESTRGGTQPVFMPNFNL